MLRFLRITQKPQRGEKKKNLSDDLLISPSRFIITSLFCNDHTIHACIFHHFISIGVIGGLEPITATLGKRQGEDHTSVNPLTFWLTTGLLCFK